MTSVFTVESQVSWSDTDQNGHMRTTAYLGLAEDVRMQYFAARGYDVDAFAAERIGPVIREDVMQYRAECGLLEPLRVELTLCGLAEDGAAFRMRNRIIRADGKTAAVATSSGGWLDLAARRLTVPSPALLKVLDALGRDEDFEVLSSPLRH